MNFENVYILEDRGILYVNGSDAQEFLQNLVTNDVNKVTDNYSCFASLLTPQGKYLYDFLIIRYKSGYFIDCAKDQSEDLYRQLSLYKLRSKVEIINLSNEFVVAAFNYERLMKFDEANDTPGFTFKYREDPIILDPRNKMLGGRLIINLEKLYLSLKKLQLNDSNKEEYYELSHSLGIPQKNMNKLKNKLFGIECNFDELNGIDFKKGCYVGQENTARIKLKNKITKRLLPIKIIEGKINEDDQIFNENVDIGKILIDKDYPYGLIKITTEKIDFGAKYNTNSATLKIIKPNWLNLS
ncbi:folate-binding protein [Candidatus Pelagibacter sp.]|nr:folate-binding protein [Candidatus Pelagibacter sp.]